jgi:hypothetical protein
MAVDRKFRLHAALCDWNCDVDMHNLHSDRIVVSHFSAGRLLGKSNLLDAILSPGLESRDSISVVRHRNRPCTVPSTHFYPDHCVGSRVLSHLRDLRHITTRPRHGNVISSQGTYASLFHMVVVVLARLERFNFGFASEMQKHAGRNQQSTGKRKVSTPSKNEDFSDVV